MFLELDPGHPSGGRARRRAGASPLGQDAARREPGRDPGAARRRHARVPAGAAQRRRRGARRATRPAPSCARRSSGSSRTARDAGKITGQLSKRRRNIQRVIHNFQELVHRAGLEGQAAGRARRLGQRQLPGDRRRRSANLREALRLLPGTLAETRDTLAKTSTLAGELGPALQQAAARRARARRRRCAQTRPFAARHHAGHPRRDPPVRARRPPGGAGHCARPPRTWRWHARA